MKDNELYSFRIKHKNLPERFDDQRYQDILEKREFWELTNWIINKFLKNGLDQLEEELNEHK